MPVDGGRRGLHLVHGGDTERIDLAAIDADPKFIHRLGQEVVGDLGTSRAQRDGAAALRQRGSLARQPLGVGMNADGRIHLFSPARTSMSRTCPA